MQSDRLEITDVKQHLEEWRATRRKQGPIPENLWMEILSLIGRYNSSALSRELGLSSQQLKNKMNEVANKEFEQVQKAHFASVTVEDGPTVAADDNVVPFNRKHRPLNHDVEITRPDGSILKVTDVPQDEVKAIITAFIC